MSGEFFLVILYSILKVKILKVVLFSKIIVKFHLLLIDKKTFARHSIILVIIYWHKSTLVAYYKNL